MVSSVQARPASQSQFRLRLGNQVRKHLETVLVTGLGLALMIAFLMPLGYMITTAFKLDSQASAQNAPLWPAKALTYNYQGKDLPIYNVPTDGGMKRYALVKGYREDSDFIDPQHPEQGVINWKGRY